MFPLPHFLSLSHPIESPSSSILPLFHNPFSLPIFSPLFYFTSILHLSNQGLINKIIKILGRKDHKIQRIYIKVLSLFLFHVIDHPYLHSLVHGTCVNPRATSIKFWVISYTLVVKITFDPLNKNLTSRLLKMISSSPILGLNQRR